MKLKRVDSNKVDQEINRVEIEVNGIKYTLTDDFGSLRVHAHAEEMIVKPACANEVALLGINHRF